MESVADIRESLLEVLGRGSLDLATGEFTTDACEDCACEVKVAEPRRLLDVTVYDEEGRLLTRALVPEDAEDLRASLTADSGRLTEKPTNLYRVTIQVTIDLPID